MTALMIGQMRSGRDQEYYPLCSEILSSIVGWRFYKECLDFLMEKEIIERESARFSKGRARRYRFAQKYQESEVQGMPIKNKAIKRNLNKFYEQKGGIGKLHEWINKSFEGVTVKNKEEILEGLEGKPRLHREFCFKCMENKEYFGSVDKRTGRYFYAGTSLSKDMRAQLLMDGEEVSEIDLSASQAFFAATLYKEGEEDERDKFLSFIEGDFYTMMNKSAGSPFKDRDAAKTGCFVQIFFGSHKMNGPMNQAMRKEFPILQKRIYDLKRSHPNENKSKKGNQYFATLLQKIEADCIFAVVKELEKKKIKCLTVHDSIICKKKHKDEVSKLMLTIIENKVGLRPILK